MAQSTPPFIGLDVHKESTAVAHASGGPHRPSWSEKSAVAAENFGNWDLAELRIPAEPSLLGQTRMPMTTSGRCEWQTSQFDLRLGRRTVSAVCSRDVPNADYDEAIKRPDGVSSLRAELTPSEIAIKTMALCRTGVDLE